MRVGKVGGYLPHDDANIPFLGEAQWAWFDKQLRKPAEIRLVCSSTQIIPDKKGMDEWGCFPRERQRLFDLIETTKADGVILLSGNVHFSKVSRVEATVYPFLDFTSSGLTHINEVYAKADNEFRVAGPFVELNFGLVEIDWSARPSGRITLRAVAADGSTGFSHRVSLHQLQSTAK